MLAKDQNIASMFHDARRYVIEQVVGGRTATLRKLKTSIRVDDSILDGVGIDQQTGDLPSTCKAGNACQVANRPVVILVLLVASGPFVNSRLAQVTHQGHDRLAQVFNRAGFPRFLRRMRSPGGRSD